VTDGGSEFAEIRDALVRARAELAAIETELANSSAGAVIALHPGIADEYRRCVAGLRELLADPDEDRVYAARQQIRSLIDQVIVSPAQRGPGTSIALEGRLAAILGLAGGGPASGLYDSGGAQEGTHTLAYRLKHASI
jgi:site-specific DNA recombinase